MRKWWERANESFKAALFCAIGILLAFGCAMLSMFFLYGTGHREINPATDEIPLLISSFMLAGFAVYWKIPIFYFTWGLVTTLAYFKKKSIVLLILMALGWYAYAYTSKILQHQLTPSDIYFRLPYLINNWGGIYLFLSILLLLGLIFGLLYLPNRLRFNLFVAVVAAPMVGIGFIFFIRIMFPDFGHVTGATG